MRKPILRVGMALLCLWLLCLSVTAAEPLDAGRRCTLSLRYAYDGVGMAGQTVGIHRVAEAYVDGTFGLVAPFDSYGVSIHDVTDPVVWKDLAAYLNSCGVADRLTPIQTQTTAADGSAVFADLQTGLYLVSGMTVTAEGGIYAFDSFLTYLPYQQEGVYVYDVEATPKGVRYDPQPQEKTYRVRKLWKDEGHTAVRPAAVTVALYENGALRESVTLTAENNWTYAWTDDGVGEWTVVETAVPDGYTATLAVKDTTFTLTNTYQKTDEPAPPPPQTGDTSALMLYVVLLCLSGAALVLVALALLRGERYEKKH